MIGLLIKVTGNQNSAPAALFMIAAYNMRLVCMNTCVHMFLSIHFHLWQYNNMGGMDAWKREILLYFQCLGTLL